MVSFDASGAPLWVIVVVIAIVAVCYLGTGFLSEITWRNATLKDLEIARRLREGSATEASNAAAKDMEDKAIKRIDAHLHKMTAASLTVGVLVRAVPAFMLSMVVWPFTVLYGIWEGQQLTLLDVGRSFMAWVLGGLMLEGVLSVARPFVTPLSERRARYAAGVEKGRVGDDGEVRCGEE